jgi:hypothetical protein
MVLGLLVIACNGEKDSEESPPPFGMILKDDNQLYAGVARIDITPEITEGYTDLNGNHIFDGCVNDPSASRTGCDEPFEDLNGNGEFDAIWISGFGIKRAATGVHDPITAGGIVFSLNGEYVAIVGIDGIGFLENRITPAREALNAEGFEKDRVVISASHSHQSPDTVGIWGDLDNVRSGINPDYQESIEQAIFDVVSTAASVMEPVSPVQGQIHMSDFDPELSGAPFGGTNPDDWMIGTIDDIRDPLIAGDQLLAVGLDGANGRVATLVNFSSHPEVVGDENSELSADYVYYLRDYVDRVEGGTTVFISGALGGMQSGLSGTLPSVDEDGNKLKDENGDTIFIEGNGWEGALAQGAAVGSAVDAVLTDTTAWDKISVSTAPLPIPVTNEYYQIAFNLGILDTQVEDLVMDSSCPGYGTDNDVFGCVPAGVWLIQLGPVTFASVPGELFPELFWGVPDEPAMSDESLRASDRRWKQQDADCVGLDYADCKDVAAIGECDCLHYHAVPYRISDDSSVTALIDMLPGTFKAPLGIANGYCGYIVPEPDFSNYASQLTEDGDHYEETNSCAGNFATLIQEAYIGLTGN